MNLPAWPCRPTPIATVRTADLVIEVYERSATCNRKPPAPDAAKPVRTTGIVIPFPGRRAA